MTSHVPISPTAPARPAYVRRPRQALVAAAIVAAVLLLQKLAGVFFWLPAAIGQGDQAASLWGVGFELVADVLPFAAGVFVVLWLVPVSTADRIAVVLVRALLATAGGVVAALVLGAFGALLLMPGRGFGYLLGGITEVVASTLDRAPLVMLVVLVQWVIARESRA